MQAQNFKHSPLELLLKFLRSYGIVAVVIVAFVALAALNPVFLSANNLKTLFYGISLDIYVIIGFTLLLIMGEVDLSIGSVYAFCGMIVGWLSLSHVPMVVAVPIGILAGSLIGLFNGLMVVKLKVNSIILTIGTLIAVRGMADILATVMAGRRFGRDMRALPKAELLDLAWTIPVMIIIVIVGEILLKRTTVFRAFYLIGQNTHSAEVYGIRTDRMRIAGFVLCGALAAASGILVAARITNPDVNLGFQLEFSILTATVLGGASLYGGRGSILNSAAALLFLAIVLNTLILIRIDPVFQQIVIGALLIVVVIADTRLHASRK